jgi:hypothetical protein
VAIPPLQQLVGLSGAQGFTRAGFHDGGRMPQPDEAMWGVNTCQAWRDDGELMAHVRAGDVEGLKGDTARRTRR